MENNKCYVLANGECVSPLSCAHGDGVSLEEFVRIIEKPLKDEIKALNADKLDLQNRINSFHMMGQ